MTTPKAWVEREKRKVAHEFRSRAHRRLNTVAFVCVVIWVCYTRVGRAHLVVEVAKIVPILWKCLTLLTMFATLWYINWRIESRAFDLSRPRLGTAWVAWLAFVAFGFAVISAD